MHAERSQRRRLAALVNHPWSPYVFMSSLYLMLAAMIRVHRAGPDWGNFLLVTDQILHGHLFYIYHNRFGGSDTFAYPPVSVLLLVPFRAVSLVLRLGQRETGLFVVLPYLAFDILAALCVVDLVKRFRRLDRHESALTFGLYLMAWMVFFATPYHAHFESVVVTFIVLGLRLVVDGRYDAGAVSLAIALLTKQTALTVLIPVLAVILFGRGWRPMLRFATISCGLAVAMMTPFFVLDFPDVIHMGLELPAILPFAYQSTWWIFTPDQLTFLYPRIAAHVDTLILVLCVAYSLVVAWRGRIQTRDPRLVGLCAGSSVIVVLLEKWGSLHYFVLPMALLLVWETSTQKYPWLTITFSAILSHIFVLAYSFETRYPFNSKTATVMIVLFLGTLTYLTTHLWSRPRAGDVEAPDRIDNFAPYVSTMDRNHSLRDRVLVGSRLE